MQFITKDEDCLHILRGGNLDRIEVGRVIKVISGTAWITLDQRDIFIRAGEQFRIPLTQHKVLISPVGHGSNNILIYRVSRGDERL